jgi:hypothetical protein
MRNGADIGFPAQIGDVDAGPAPRHQDAVDFLPDPLEKFEILFQGKVFVVVFAHVVWRRGDHQVDALVRDFRGLRRIQQDRVEEFRRHRIFDILAGLGRGNLGVELAGIESRGVVGYSSRGAEGAGAGLLFGGIIFHSRGKSPMSLILPWFIQALYGRILYCGT